VVDGVVIDGVGVDVAWCLTWHTGQRDVEGVVAVLDLIPDPAWLCVSIHKGGGRGWDSPWSALPSGGQWWCWTMAVAEERGGVVVVGKEQPMMGSVVPRFSIWPHAARAVRRSRTHAYCQIMRKVRAPL